MFKNGNIQGGINQQPLLHDGDDPSKKKDANSKSKLLIALCLATVWAGAYLVFALALDNDSDSVQGFSEFDVAESLTDMFGAAVLRIVVVLIALLAPKSIHLAFWVQFVSCLTVWCKLLVFDAWSDGALAAFLGAAFIFNCVEWHLVRQTRSAAIEAAEAAQKLKADEESPADQKPKQKLSLTQLLKVLRPYFWPEGTVHKLRVLATWVLLVGSKVTTIMAPIFIGRAANELVEGRLPWMDIMLYALLGYLSSLFKELQNIVYLQVKQQAFIEIASLTFKHLHTLSLEWHLKKKMGNVLRSMDRGVASADTMVTYGFLYLGPSLIECLAMFVIFYVQFEQPWLTVVAIWAVVAYVILTVKVTLWRKKFRAKTNKHDNDFHDKATDSLINYETVKYFANEDYEIASYRESVTQYQKYSVDTQASLGVLNNGQQFIIKLSVFTALAITAYSVQRGDLVIGDFVSVNVYIIQLFAPLGFLGTVYNMIIQAIVDMTNLSELLALDPDVYDDPNARPVQYNTAKGVKVEFKDVVFRYPSQADNKGLKGLSFTVEPGTTTAIVGSTGAGKTTVGRLLFRFYDVLSGQVLIDGQDVREVTQKSLRGMMGVVPQDTVMFNDTIAHNVRYGRLDATRDEMEEACKAAKIIDFIYGLDNGWESKVGERGLKLSGGEKQRVAIARALLKNPPIVLLDEATSALDSVTEKEIQQSLTMLSENRTTLIIAHRLSTIRHAHQIVVLRDGVVAEKGTHEQLLAKGGEYSNMWNIQMQELEEAQEESNEKKENEE